jgi:hypothetical protein
MQVQAFGKITRLRLPPRKYGVHRRPPKSILKGYCRAGTSSLVYSPSCFDLQNDDPGLRAGIDVAFDEIRVATPVTRIAGEIPGQYSVCPLSALIELDVSINTPDTPRGPALFGAEAKAPGFHMVPPTFPLGGRRSTPSVKCADIQATL